MLKFAAAVLALALLALNAWELADIIRASDAPRRYILFGVIAATLVFLVAPQAISRSWWVLLPAAVVAALLPALVVGWNFYELAGLPFDIVGTLAAMKAVDMLPPYLGAFFLWKRVVFETSTKGQASELRWVYFTGIAGAFVILGLWWQLTADRCPKLTKTAAEIESSPGLSRSELLAAYEAADARDRCFNKEFSVPPDRRSFADLLRSAFPRPGSDQWHMDAMSAKNAAQRRLGPGAERSTTQPPLDRPTAAERGAN